MGRKKAERRRQKTIQRQIDHYHKLLENSTPKPTVNRNYKTATLPQPIASLAVRGLIRVLKWESLGDYQRGDIVIIYAEKSTKHSNKVLWNDDVLYSTFSNAVCMGNLENTPELPVDLYIGYVIVGERTKNGYYGILDFAVFEQPTEKLPRYVDYYKPRKATNYDISLENDIIKIPVSDYIWGRMEDPDDCFFEDATIVLYWKQRFNKLYSSKYGFGNENGLYDIVFTNNGGECRFVQDDRNAIKKETCKERGMRWLPAMVIYAENISSKRRSDGSSFDILKTRDWILDWNCVTFRNDFFIVNPPTDGSIKFKPKPVYHQGVLESYNYLGDYLNGRLEQVRCSVEGMELNIYDKIRLNEAIAKFSAAARQRAISATVGVSTTRSAPQPMSFNQALSKAQQMTEEEFKKYKSKYIDFLVEYQYEEYKVIPCIERLAHADSDMTEYAFLFSIKTQSGNILIIHENVNPDRASLLFVVKENSYNSAIREIYDFLQGAEVNKRSSLRGKNIDVENPGIISYRSINHDDINSWQRMIRRFF